MSFVGKWFGFGKDQAFDDGIRAYEKRSFADALGRFRDSLGHAQDLAVRERAKSYVAGCLGKLARESMNHRDFEDAEKYLIEAIDVRPGFADLWLSLAQVRRALGNRVQAMADVEKALEINPNYSAGLALRGTLLYKTGQHAEGLSDVHRAVAFDHRLAGKAWDAAQSAHEAGDHEKAYEELLQIKPHGDDANDLVAAGDHHAKKGDWKQAEAHYRAALEIAPSYADVRCRHGQALMELSELHSATQAFQHAIAINPDYSEAYALMGVVLRRSGDEENALIAFRHALDIDPHHPIASQEVLYRRR